MANRTEMMKKVSGLFENCLQAKKCLAQSFEILTFQTELE
jgi:hypothetical protein